jgi:hypothetical protein
MKEKEGAVDMKVALDALADELEMMMEEFDKFLDLETGDVITVSTEELALAKDAGEDKAFSEFSEWEREAVLLAGEIIEHKDRYLELPKKNELHEYDLMAAFVKTVKNENMARPLFDAIHGKGTFRRFKDTLLNFGIEQQWYDFRFEGMKTIARNWCEAHGVEYEEGGGE